MIQIDPVVYFFFPLLLLTAPINWLAAALFAGIFHELSHIAMILLLKGKLFHMRIGIGGAEIQAGLQGNGRSFLSILSGPLGSLLLVFFCRQFPRVAICGVVQGVFNLLPIYPLDGGKMMGLAINALFPEFADKLLRAIEWTVLLSLAIGAAAAWLICSGGIVPILLFFDITGKVIMRKKPCKQGPNKIQ